jgi:hypothetical protein
MKSAFTKISFDKAIPSDLAIAGKMKWVHRIYFREPISFAASVSSYFFLVILISILLYSFPSGPGANISITWVLSSITYKVSLTVTSFPLMGSTILPVGEIVLVAASHSPVRGITS